MQLTLRIFSRVSGLSDLTRLPGEFDVCLLRKAIGHYVQYLMQRSNDDLMDHEVTETQLEVLRCNELWMTLNKRK